MNCWNGLSRGTMKWPLKLWSPGTVRWYWESAVSCFAIPTTSTTRFKRHFWCWSARRARFAGVTCWVTGSTALPTGWRRGLEALSARRNSRVASGHDSVESLTNLECGQEVGLNQTMLLEQGPWLHQEVSHLPEKYRVPIVLCYFEGLTHDEAASRLGWPLGTVKGRLARARDLLRRRLTRRGVTLSATALASHLAGLEAKAAVPASLRMTTLKAAYALALRGRCVTGQVLGCFPTGLCFS